ncbi:AraC family transcriptional regulator [Elizabethkingia ursingii]|uniref:helix-turn-helix domain-containing protein n=1 Tax=Elizabethkingia ursingii TaxID=1756150 RepID=UPI0020120CCB|nr:AraC family transcriptional regulator [Elizabethkingia ursingii]MCL1667699.1 AraC family transcriptional regulator [Elizabethkingia ursingii]
MIKCFYALVLFSALTFAQVTDSFNISGYIRKLYYLDTNSRPSTPRTDQEKILTYIQMADSLYKQLRYPEAIKLYEQADYYALKNNHNKERFVINYFLSDVYQSIGFSNKANEYWGIACSFSNSLDKMDTYIMTNLYKARRMEHSNQFHLAILYRQKNIGLLNKKYLDLPKSKSIIFQQKIDLALEYNIIAYDYLKNNNLYEAKKNFEKTEFYLKDINTDTYYQTPYYDLCKAMIAAKENKREEARKWFDFAEKIAEKKGYQVFSKRISEEKILSKIGQLDDHSSKSFKEFFKKILTEVQRVNELEIKREEKKVTDQNSQIEHWKSFFILLTAILTLYIIIKDKKIYKKRPPNHTETVEIAFTQEIKHISENDIQPTENFSFINLNYENITRTSTLISEAKESELLEKLNQFEVGTDFMAKNFTLSNLASILDTNTKYVHYLLKAHRNKNFNDYINGLKIKYIVHCLCKEPKFQNYKISYLADIGGFSSQSRFAYIFKKEVGLSPSEFIRTLKRKNKTQ